MGSIKSTNLEPGAQSPFETEFQKCRLRRKLGHFNEVVAGLERLRASDENLSVDDQAQVVGHIAWTRLSQGFFKESHEILDRWMLSLGTDVLASSISSETKAFLELLMEFSRVNCHGDPSKSIEIAQTVFDQQLRDVELKDYDYTLVCSPHLLYTCMMNANVFPDTSGGLLPTHRIICG